MGMTTLKATIKNPQEPKKQTEVEFLVDSGAIYSVIDKTILTELHVKPHGQKEFTLANGQIIKRKIGGLVYEYGGETGYAPVIFGEKGDSNLLGTVTLESLGYVLDPLKRRLLKLPLVLG